MTTHLIFSKCLVPTTKQKRGSQRGLGDSCTVAAPCLLHSHPLALSRSLQEFPSPLLPLSEQQGGFWVALSTKLLEEKHLPPGCCSQELPHGRCLLWAGFGPSVLTSQLQQAGDAEEPPLHGWGNCQKPSLPRSSEVRPGQHRLLTPAAALSSCSLVGVQAFEITHLWGGFLLQGLCLWLRTARWSFSALISQFYIVHGNLTIT